MQPNLITTLTAITLALAAPTASASGLGHDHGDSHGAASASLQLDAGRKWQTDAPLRLAMADIRQALAGALHAVHADQLAAAGYDALARKVEDAAGQIVANCKLAPQADAQFHLILAELLAGAEQMAGKAGARRDGAVKVIGALEKYGAYFDDPGFQPIAQ